MNTRQIKKYLKKQKDKLENKNEMIKYWDTMMEIKIYKVFPNWCEKEEQILMVKDYMDIDRFNHWIDLLLSELRISFYDKH